MKTIIFTMLLALSGGAMANTLAITQPLTTTHYVNTAFMAVNNSNQLGIHWNPGGFGG